MGAFGVAARRVRRGWLPALAWALLVVASGAHGQGPAPGPAPDTAAPPVLLEPFAVDGGSLKLTVPRGALTVRPSTDDRVHVRGTLAAGQRLRQAAMPGGRLLALVDEARLFPAAATLDVQVPAALSLSIDVAAARLDLEGVDGPTLHVDGGSGPIRLVSAAKAVKVRSRSGPLELELSGERLDVGTVTGDIDLSALTTGVRLRAESVAGALRIQTGEPGPLRIESVSGRIEISTRQGQAPVSLETVTGDIDLRLAEQTAAALRFEPGTRPLGLRGGLVAAADGRARLAGGTWPLRLATLSGGLTVRQGSGVLAEPEPIRD
jgi:hypothetical protein